MTSLHRLKGGRPQKQEIDRDYPHQVEIAAVLCKGENENRIRGFCRTRMVASRRYYACRNGNDFLTWCFAKIEDAHAFQERHGGRYMTPGERRGRRLSLL